MPKNFPTRSRIFALLISTLTFGEASYGDLYVAPYGDDSAAGTLADPLATIQAASNAATPGETVYIREGIYRESLVPTCTGTENAPIVFKAYDLDGITESVVISSFDPIVELQDGAGSWVQHSANIWKISLSSDYDRGAGRNLALYNRDPMIEARWPNAPGPFNFDYRIMARNDASTYDSSSSVTYPPYSGVFRTASYTDTDLPAGPDDQWAGAFIALQPGSGSHLHTGIVTSSSGDTINLIFKPAAASSNPIDNEPYYLWNSLVALDSPGETFFDTSSDTLYVWHEGGSAPSPGLIEKNRRFYSLDIGGNAYLRFENLTFEGGKVLCRTLSNHIVFDRITSRYAGYGLNLLSGTEACIHLTGDNATIKNSDIVDSWGGGIHAKGQNIVIDNNLVLNCAQYGVGTWDGHNVSVTRNTIAASARMNVAMYATSSDYLHNHCYLAGMTTTDEASMNTNYNGNALGSTIAYNWVHHNIGRRDTTRGISGGKGIRLDSSTVGVSNYLIHHNIIWEVSSGRGLTLWALEPGAPSFGNSMIRAYHNTVIGSLSLQSKNSTASIAGHDIRNNIFQKILKYEGVGEELAINSHNLIYDGPNNAWPLNTYDAARFSNLSVDDYSLSSESIGIDLGDSIAELNQSFNGVAPDAGAIEHVPGAPSWTAGATVLTEYFDHLTYKIVVQNDGSRELTVNNLQTGRVMPDGFQVRLGGTVFSPPKYRYDIQSHLAEVFFLIPEEHPEGTQVLEVSYDGGQSYEPNVSLLIPPTGVSFDPTVLLTSQPGGGDQVVIAVNGTLSKNKLIPFDIENMGPDDLSLDPVPIVVDTASLIASGELLADGSNIRFRTSDGTIVLRHYLESGLNTNSTLFWLRLPSGATNNGDQLYVALEDFGVPEVSDPTVVYNAYPSLLDPSLRIWISANSIATSLSDFNTPQASIPDLSPQKISITQATASYQPLLAQDPASQLPYLKFDGVNDRLDAGTLVSGVPGNASVLIIYQNNANTATDSRIISSSAPGSNEVFSTYAENTNPEWQFKDTRKACGGLEAFSIGKKSRSNKKYYNGHIAEILVFDVHVETSEWSKLKVYLSRKYQLAEEARGQLRLQDTIQPVQLFLGDTALSDFSLLDGSIHFTSPAIPPGVDIPYNLSISIISGTTELVVPNGLTYFLPAFDSWAQSHGGHASIPNFDGDNDGMSNLLEFLYGLDPHTADLEGFWIGTYLDEESIERQALFFRRSAISTDTLITIETLDPIAGAWNKRPLSDFSHVIVNPDADNDGSFTAIYCVPIETDGLRRLSVRLLVP